MAVQLLDENNNPVDVPEEHVAEAISSGKYAAPGGADQPIPVTIAGQLGTVPVSKLSEAIKQHGAVVASADEVQKAQEAKEAAIAAKAHTEQYGGFGGKAASLAGGALDTATFGLGNYALSDEQKKYVRESEAENPGYKTIGQGIGLAAPLAADIFTGGTATPELLAGEAGAVGAEEGAGLLANAARGTAKAVALPSRALGAVGDAAGDLTEAGLRKLVGGEATSVAGKLASKGLIGAAKGSTEGALMGLAQTAGDEAIQEHPDLTAEKLMHGGLLGAALGGIGGGVLGLGGEVGSRYLGDTSRLLSRGAEDQAAKAIIESSGSKVAKQMAELDGGVRGVTRTLLDDGIIQAGDRVEHIAPKIAQAREAAQTEVDRIQTELGAIPEVTGAPKTIEEARAYMRTPEGQKSLTELLRKDGPGTTEALAKGQVPEGLFPAANVPSEGLTQPDPKLLEALDAAQLKLKRLTLADEAASSYVEKNASKAGESAFSPLAALAGHALGGIHGGPLGVAAGLASGVGKAALRERGSATAAVVLDKLATTQALQRASEQSDRIMSRIVQGAVTGAVGKEYKHKIEVPEGYAAQRDMILKVASHPDVLENIQASVAPLTTNHPDVAAAYVRKTAGALSYLVSQLPPQERPNPDSLTPQLDKREVPPEEEDAFTAKVSATYNPMGAIAKIQTGTMTSDERDAIIATHPEIYASACQNLKEALSTAKEPPTYQAEQSIRMFLQLPLISSALASVLTAPKPPSAQPPTGHKPGSTSAPKRVLKTDFSGNLKLP